MAHSFGLVFVGRRIGRDIRSRTASREQLAQTSERRYPAVLSNLRFQILQLSVTGLQNRMTSKEGPKLGIPRRTRRNKTGNGEFRPRNAVEAHPGLGRALARAPGPLGESDTFLAPPCAAIPRSGRPGCNHLERGQ